MSLGTKLPKLVYCDSGGQGVTSPLLWTPPQGPLRLGASGEASESALASRFDVSGYPTIKILKKGQEVDYEGSRTQEGEGPEPPEEVGAGAPFPMKGLNSRHLSLGAQ